jgi:HJR/Mrr/RecB family endonuclease
MNTVQDFVVGQKYSNDQIRYSLNLENLGGIRPSIGGDSKLRHLAVMTTLETARKRKQENPYEDRIEGDVLIYTASGKEGDQKLEGKNKRLLEQYAAPVPFFGFANEGKQVYHFLGLMELLRHYSEVQLDRAGNLRTVWLFEFRIHRQPEIVPIASAGAISASLIADSRARSPLETNDQTVVVPPPPEKERERVAFIEAEQLRAAFLTINPYRFEHLLRDLVMMRGFREVVVTKSSGDGGIDLSAYVPPEDDFFAGTFVQFQAKRWRHSVGSTEINSFRGALSGTAKGVFVTTSHFTKAAIEEGRHLNKPAITLIDGLRLARMVQGVSLDITPFL